MTSFAAPRMNAYDKAARAIGDPRAVEAQLLGRITGALIKALQTRDANHPGFVAALSTNLQVWTTLAAEVAADGNALPLSLRAEIFGLARFTRSLTFRILGGDRSADPQALIDLNLSIIKGLRGDTAQRADPAEGAR